MKDQRHGGARVHAAGFLFADQLPAHRGGLERLGGDARTVVLEHQLVAVAGLAEVHAHDAGFLLGMRAPHFRRLDAVHGRVAQHLDEAVLDGRGVCGRHVGESRHCQPEALGVILGQPLGHRMQHRRQILHRPGLRPQGGGAVHGCGGRGHRSGGGFLERRETRGHLAHAAQVRQQIIELQDQRQEVVARQLGPFLAV